MKLNQHIWGNYLSFPCHSSLALLSAPHDRNLMRISTGKNRPGDLINPDILLRFTRTFLLRWLPSVLIVLLCQTLLLSEACRDGSLTCYPVIPHLTHPKPTLRLAQNFAAVLVVLYFSVISMGYGNSKPGFWKYSPLKNKFWILAVSLAWLLQLVYFFSDVPLHLVTGGYSNTTRNSTAVEKDGSSKLDEDSVIVIPFWVWLTGFLWPLFLLPLNELIKKFELAELDKQQKRADSSLALNSAWIRRFDPFFSDQCFFLFFLFVPFLFCSLFSFLALCFSLCVQWKNKLRK